MLIPWATPTKAWTCAGTRKRTGSEGRIPKMARISAEDGEYLRLKEEHRRRNA